MNRRCPHQSPRQGPHFLGVRKRRPGGQISGGSKLTAPQILIIAERTSGDAASTTDPFCESRKTIQKCEHTDQKWKNNGVTNPHDFGRFLEVRKWTDFEHQSPIKSRNWNQNWKSCPIHIVRETGRSDMENVPAIWYGKCSCSVILLSDHVC
jgi:hypothetical protein